MLEKKLFFNIFSAGIKKKVGWNLNKRLELKKKWAGIKYFGLELIFFIENQCF